MVDIVGSFWKKNWLSGLWYQDQHWLSAKTPIFGLKSRKRARYYRRVLREKLTFGTMISRETVIIGQNYGGRGYDQNTWLSRYARLSMSDKNHSWLSAFTLDRLQKVEQNARSSILITLGGGSGWCICSTFRDINQTWLTAKKCGENLCVCVGEKGGGSDLINGQKVWWGLTWLTAKKCGKCSISGVVSVVWENRLRGRGGDLIIVKK